MVHETIRRTVIPFGRYNLTRDPLDAIRSSVPETTLGPRNPFMQRYNIAPSEPPVPSTSKRTTPARQDDDGA